MSCNEWEAGTIKIPTRAWAPLKKALREAWNQQRDELTRKAEFLQAKLAEHYKGKREVPEHEIREYLWTQVGRLNDDQACDVIRLTLATLKEGSASRTKKITQAMIDQHIGPKATSKTASYEGSEWDISLNNEQCSVRWEVHENNHAVERARESRMGDLLFRELKRIDYGKLKTMGGVIAGNNEYNREADGAGDGGNYISETFGKAGESERTLMRGW